MAKVGDAAARLSRSNSLQAQGFKFLLVGIFSAFIDGGLTWLFQIGLGLVREIPARTIGFVVGTTVAYLINRRWTFNASGSKRRFAAVAATYALTYAVNIAAYRWLFGVIDHDWGWPSSWALWAAFVIAQGSATILNFLVQRWVIFRRTHKSYVVED